MKSKADLHRMWIKERDRAIFSGDIEKFKAFYERWYKKGMHEHPLTVDDRVLGISIHKMICSHPSATPEEKTAAEKWLRDRGYSTDH